ncbi:formimidoylglutamate deiminase [Sphingomonas sp. PR090111-T3T-6A]|uniref:formimidoylglutamate deiminase n=1 Tax=Sphingomonas sp. PR090111-T3T-6A TaxID=685778 RepID=UPI00037262A9|nr:formimidoylglutamate deiminase [Sphingomonas sp. PR090111-T3T-6A]
MTLWFETALLPGGWAQRVRVTLAGGRIATVEEDVAAGPGDERHAAGLPGLPNLHSHAFQRAMAGLAERPGGVGRDDFWSWRETMYGLVGRLTPEDVAVVAAQAFMEMLEAGFTRVGEFHYLHHDLDGRPYAEPARMAAAVADAATETGIALTLLPVFYAHSGFGGAAPKDGQRRFINDLDGFARLREGCAEALRPLDGAVLGVAPHSLRAATPEQLSALLAMAPEGPVHIHIAEQVPEVEACLAWSGRRPVEWLLDRAAVDARWCLVHATHVEPAEVAGIEASTAVVGLCPVTEANLGDGLFPAAAFGGRFGVGSDSNVRIDAAEELRLLEYGQRLVRRQRNVLARDGVSTGRTLFGGALAGGAQALGAEAPALVAGAPADIVALADDGEGVSGDALLDRWIFARSRIDSVWRAGRQVVREGCHVARDRIARRYRETLRRLAG